MDICDRADGRDRPKEGVARIMAGLVLPTLLRSRALLRNPYAGGCAVRFVSRYATRPRRHYHRRHPVWSRPGESGRREWRLLCNALNSFRHRRIFGGLALLA